MFTALELHRAAERIASIGVPGAAALRRVTGALFATHIGPGVIVGPGTELAHGGLGVHIDEGTRLGAGVRVGPHVTFARRPGIDGAPVVEDGVNVGAGACILGPVRVGRGARIGAHAVVVEDVPAGAVVVALPGRAADGRGDRAPVHHA